MIDAHSFAAVYCSENVPKHKGYNFISHSEYPKMIDTTIGNPFLSNLKPIIFETIKKEDHINTRNFRIARKVNTPPIAQKVEAKLIIRINHG